MAVNLSGLFDKYNQERNIDQFMYKPRAADSEAGGIARAIAGGSRGPLATRQEQSDNIIDDLGKNPSASDLLKAANAMLKFDTAKAASLMTQAQKKSAQRSAALAPINLVAPAASNAASGRRRDKAMLRAALRNAGLEPSLADLDPAAAFAQLKQAQTQASAKEVAKTLAVTQGNQATDLAKTNADQKKLDREAAADRNNATINSKVGTPPKIMTPDELTVVQEVIEERVAGDTGGWFGINADSLSTGEMMTVAQQAVNVLKTPGNVLTMQQAVDAALRQISKKKPDSDIAKKPKSREEAVAMWGMQGVGNAEEQLRMRAVTPEQFMAKMGYLP